MEISEFTLKLILILVPGAIASIIFEKLTIYKKWSAFDFTAMSVLFGGISYLFAQFILTVIPCFDQTPLENFWQNLHTKVIPYSAILSASIASIFVALGAAAIDHYKLINMLGRKLHISNKYGDENLYSYFLNASNINEVYVRDKAKGLTYHGVIDSFSETDDFKEIVLRDVHVYNYEDSSKLYDVDKLYIARCSDDITLEVPYLNEENNEKEKSKI